MNTPCISDVASIRYYLEKLTSMLKFKNKISVIELANALIVIHNQYSSALREEKINRKLKERAK